MDFFTSIAGYICILLVLSFILIKTANVAVSAAHALLAKSKTNKYGTAVFFVALAQCLPEMIIALVASSNHQSQIAVAAVIGSNIANISLILGGAALIAGSLRAVDSFIKNEIAYVLLIGALPPLLLLDGSVTRIEALFLLIVYVLYQLNESRKKAPSKEVSESTQKHIKKLFISLTKHSVEKKVAVFFASSIGMVLISEVIIRVTQAMATKAAVPLFLVTLLIVSIGTSLPELIFEIIAIKKRENGMAFASVLGSVVTDSTLTLGLSALIFPISLGNSERSYLISVIGFIVIFLLFWRSVWTKHRLDRQEGAVLVLIYFLFGTVQYLFR